MVVARRSDLLNDPAIGPDITAWLPTLVPVFITALVITGILLALAISLRGAAPADRSAIVRALAELFRKGGPPTAGL